jgi:hypothetical protein
LGPTALHREYIRWAGNRQLTPLRRTAFAKCVDRHADGWRVAGSKWEHTG